MISFALKEFFRGVAFTIGIVGVGIIAIAILSGGEDENTHETTCRSS